jgi:hypothetical protein
VTDSDDELIQINQQEDSLLLQQAKNLYKMAIKWELNHPATIAQRMLHFAYIGFQYENAMLHFTAAAHHKGAAKCLVRLGCMYLKVKI